MLSIDEKVQIKPNGVFGALKENLMDSLNNIGAIGQFGSSKNWTIQFKDKASFDNNLGKEISIIDVKHYLIDANLIEKREKFGANELLIPISSKGNYHFTSLHFLDLF